MLTWADSVWVILSATNAYGTSTYSDAGNGAILYTIPDAPTEVIEDLTYRTASTLGFNWQTSFYGGTPIIDYTIMSDQGLDSYTPIASGVTNKYYVAVGLTYGVTYKFKVSARNAFGDSDYSEELVLLCATKPLVPESPTTTTVND